MPSYAVDNIRQPMTGTGIVEQVMEWEETPEGKRRPSEKQAPNEKTTMPLWAVEVRYIQTTRRSEGRRLRPRSPSMPPMSRRRRR
jgi:hypothetical protein